MPSNTNNNNKKWKRGSNLQVNVNRKGTRRGMAPIRDRAGLSPLPSIHSNNTPVESEYMRFVVDPKTKKAGFKRQVFFPVNMSPNFMERKPMMKKTYNRMRKNMTKKTSHRANNLFEPRPVKHTARKEQNSPNFFENVKHLF